MQNGKVEHYNDTKVCQTTGGKKQYWNESPQEKEG